MDDCKGCKDYGDGVECMMMEWKDNCPCGLCLIKSMCETSCEEFEKFNNVNPIRTGDTK